MKRVAIVVPRCHPTLVGGAEALAWQHAQLLAGTHAVDVLTSTALDYVSWNNELPVGAEEREGVRIIRFAVARDRGGYFHDLHRRLLAREDSQADGAQRVDWPEALQEEFIRAQGPVCPGLIVHLARHGDEYDVVLFVTYLYPTTYEGSRCLAHRRWALVPTLHDEPLAHFSTIAHMARRAPRLLWNTPAEQRLGERLWGVADGAIIAMAIDTTRARPAAEPAPYLLYSGRIDAHKGCGMLLERFNAYRKRSGADLDLLLTGTDKLGLRPSRHLRYLGFVDEARKAALMAGALAFVHPSPYESLSIVVLEAMAQGTPIIVNGACEVLADHVFASSSGYIFTDGRSFDAAVDAVRGLGAEERLAQGQRARDYVLAHYSRDEVQARLVAEVELLASR
ncbi:MAG: glycosyltransferase [Xanthomonadales bacterium]|nr:glycosyltransferase [Xanthomonadales bacterium]